MLLKAVFSNVTERIHGLGSIIDKCGFDQESKNRTEKLVASINMSYMSSSDGAMSVMESLFGGGVHDSFKTNQ